jgi:hypothetical protein
MSAKIFGFMSNNKENGIGMNRYIFNITSAVKQNKQPPRDTSAPNIEGIHDIVVSSSNLIYWSHLTFNML